MFAKLMCAFLLTVLSLTAALEYIDCGSLATVNFVSLEGCTEQPCTLAVGTNYHLQVEGINNHLATDLRYTIKARFLGMPFILDSGDLCKTSEIGQCPLLPGQPFTYSKIVNSRVSLNLTVQATVEVLDQTNRNVFCGLLDVILRTH